MRKLLTGKEVAASIVENLKTRTEALRSGGMAPTLAIVRAGNNPGDIAYEKGAVKRAEACGVETRLVGLPEDISEEELVACLEDLNRDASVHGVLLMRPLPAYMNDSRVRNTLSPEKDVDGITDLSMAGVFMGSGTGFAPCTPAACLEILDYYNIPIEGKRIAIVGRSPVVGRPLAMMLMQRNATVTMCHTRTGVENMKDICNSSHILIAAAGHAGTVGTEFIRPGQTVIDVGINVNEEGRLCGDVDFETVSGIAGAITPVPGGLGSVTTAVLIKHVLEAAETMAADK